MANRTKGRPWSYTAKEIAWLRHNVPKFKLLREAVAEFNRIFSRSMTPATFCRTAKEYGLEGAQRQRHCFTDEEVRWIEDNKKKYHNLNDFLDDFAKKFHFALSKQNLHALEKRRKKKIRLDFKLPYDKIQQLPIGSIRANVDGNKYIKVKMVPCDGKRTYLYRPYWIPLKEKLYLDYGGKLEEDEVVVLLDGNIENLSMDNLCAVKRRVCNKMSLEKLWSDNKDITLAGIRYCELLCTLTDVEGARERHNRLRSEWREKRKQLGLPYV